MDPGVMLLFRFHASNANVECRALNVESKMEELKGKN